MSDIEFHRYQPTISSDIELNETDDRILLQMLCDVRKYINNNFKKLEELGKLLLGNVAEENHDHIKLLYDLIKDLDVGLTVPSDSTSKSYTWVVCAVNYS